jgi:hypothetical protein
VTTFSSEGNSNPKPVRRSRQKVIGLLLLTKRTLVVLHRTPLLFLRTVGFTVASQRGSLIFAILAPKITRRGFGGRGSTPAARSLRSPVRLSRRLSCYAVQRGLMTNREIPVSLGSKGYYWTTRYSLAKHGLVQRVAVLAGRFLTSAVCCDSLHIKQLMRPVASKLRI